jgi:hypothetical protein
MQLTATAITRLCFAAVVIAGSVGKDARADNVDASSSAAGPTAQINHFVAAGWQEREIEAAGTSMPARRDGVPAAAWECL